MRTIGFIALCLLLTSQARAETAPPIFGGQASGTFQVEVRAAANQEADLFPSDLCPGKNCLRPTKSTKLLQKQNNQP